MRQCFVIRRSFKRAFFSFVATHAEVRGPRILVLAAAENVLVLTDIFSSEWAFIALCRKSNVLKHELLPTERK